MTENQGTSDFAINYDVNGLFTVEKYCICSMGSFKDSPTVNLLDCQYLIGTEHLCSMHRSRHLKSISWILPEFRRNRIRQSRVPRAL